MPVWQHLDTSASHFGEVITAVTKFFRKSRAATDACAAASTILSSKQQLLNMPVCLAHGQPPGHYLIEPTGRHVR